jgi:hypothetical protein
MDDPIPNTSVARKGKALGALKRPWLSRPQTPGRHLRTGPLAGDTLAGTQAKHENCFVLSRNYRRRLRLRAVADALLVSGHGDEQLGANGHDPASWIASN